MVTTNRIWAIGYVIIVIGLVGAYYIDAQRDNRQRTDLAAAKSEQIEETREAVACMSRTFQEFLIGNQELRDASKQRDDALVGSKTALRELVRLRVIEQVSDSEQVRQAADQYIFQTQKFLDASKDLNVARKRYTLPDFEKECGKLPKPLLTPTPKE